MIMTDLQQEAVALEEPGFPASPEGYEERSDEGPVGEAARVGIPDPESPEKPQRRRFRAEYKLSFLEQKLKIESGD